MPNSPSLDATYVFLICSKLNMQVFDVTNYINRKFCSELTSKANAQIGIFSFKTGKSYVGHPRFGSYRLGGISLAPKFQHDPGFGYDSNEKPTVEDYLAWERWGLLASAAALVWPDAAEAYKRYRENTGESMWIDYGRACAEDEVYKRFIDDEVNKITEAAVHFYSNSEINPGPFFEMISDMFPIPNGNTVNWQRTIGAHSVYAHVYVRHNTETKSVRLFITFTTEDI